MKKNFSKLLALYLPYILLGLAATNFGEAWRLVEGKELGDKIMSMMGTVPVAFANPLPSLHPLDLLVGVCCGAGLRLAVYLRGKNAKKYRHGMEYGSARWGNAKDIEPFMAPKFSDNIILTKTERLMMSNRPPDPKNARNKNVLVVGGSSARDFKTKYISTGAATVSEDAKTLPDMDCGEGFDRSSLRLLGDQEKLISAVASTGKPLVVVYIQGRTMNMNLAAEKAQALLTAWYPGEQGGMGIADILFGDYSPAGRLPVSVPRSEGQLPVFYSQGTQRDYVESKGTPLYAFGYGLSYTRFTYSGLELQKGTEMETLQTVACTVTNTGNRDGEEVVQLYIGDKVASVSQPPLLLKAFQRIFLKKGESRQVIFHLKKDDLAIYDSEMNYVVEPGEFKVMVGAASNDIRLEGEFVL